MTRAARDRILKDANGDIGDHLRNHIHLTNCIHLKNHMHKHSPIMADRSLVKDLIVLQRSRSLKDPSASPPSWLSPSVIDLLSGRQDKDAVMVNGRRSVGIDGGSGESPLLGSLRRPEGGSGEVATRTDRSAAASNRSNKSGIQEHRRNKREQSSKKDLGTDLKGADDDYAQASDDLAHNVVATNMGLKDKKVKQKEQMQYREDSQLKTLSDQLKEVRMDSDDDKSSHNHFHGKHSQDEQIGEAEASARGHGSGVNRVKRRKFRGTRRSRPIRASKDFGAKNEISVASNSFAQNSAHHKCEGEEEYDEQNVTRAPKNGCGIPWNWSRIHHSGRSFLDIAGRSLSCGLSETKLRKDGTGMPVMSDHSSSSTKSDAEAMPLLEGSGSQGSNGNAAWVHDYSGELGIYADNLLKYEIDSDLVSEARSGDQHKFKRSGNSRHQSLTQKYMPRTFRDLVGQHLVAQALSNAVSRRKVGLLYVFYGPHGTGKTSSARVFAKALNCLSLEQPKPCGACNSCVAYETGKSRNIREVGPLSNFDSERIMDLLDSMVVSHLPSQYRVFIFDDCDALSPDCWSAISKVIDRAPKRVVFILISSSLDVLPHIIISRCQKFFLPKLKDADIIYALQWIATKEELEIDKDALRLIASRSDGSLRDAEMTLEQLSLIGQRISVPLVQELVGLISDEKLVDLLDLALSADTVNTVKHLREIMESGVEPLALMSQLATVITDILAGSYDLAKARPRRKFFRKQTLSKEDMERLRQALKTLSEAEKQLRLSNDRLTWLTAALLQLAPDQQYMLPSSSAETSINHSPLVQSNTGGRERPRKSNVEHSERSNIGRGLNYNSTRHGMSGMVFHQTHTHAADLNQTSGRPSSERAHKGIEEIWLEVLEKIKIGSIKEFLYREGKLISLSFGGAPTVQLMFNSHLAKSKAEKYREHILQAFESVLGSPVTIEIRCENRKDERATYLAGYDDTGVRTPKERDGSNQAQLLQSRSLRRGKTEIVEVGSLKGHEIEDSNTHYNRNDIGALRIRESHKNLATAALPERRKLGEQSQSMSLVRGKVSLAHVIQQAEGYTHRDGWSRRKAVSIAEKLEHENLKLEPRSRSLLCWKASRVTRRKLSRLKIRTRRSRTLMRFVSCSLCLSSKSPR